MRNHLLITAAFATLATLAPAPVVTGSAVAQVGAAPVLTHVPNNPTRHPRKPSSYDCSDQLGHMRRVFPAELATVQHHSQVWVTPVCLDDHSVFRSEGNAGALRAAIASNPAMRTALKANAFGPDDVIAVRMLGSGKATLYVYPFHK